MLDRKILYVPLRQRRGDAVGERVRRAFIAGAASHR
jgi:hypothetical protein